MNHKSRPRLQIVACADREPVASYLISGFRAFRASCARYGFDPIILGWGRPWRGLGSKPKLLKSAIDDGIVTSDHILFMDAFDTWFADSPDEILRVFTENWQSRIVWNAERACFPDASLAQYFDDAGTPYRYLNSGMSIGETDAYMECLREMDVDGWPDDYKDASGTWHHRNDQDDWMRRFLFGQCPGQVRMSLDNGCRLFQTLTGVEPDEFTFHADGRIENRITRSFPMAFHANGGSKTGGMMERTITHLGL